MCHRTDNDKIRNLALKRTKTPSMNYEFVVEDDKLIEYIDHSHLKLLTVDNVDAIISVSSGTVFNVVSPIAESNKIAHRGGASDANVAAIQLHTLDYRLTKEAGVG